MVSNSIARNDSDTNPCHRRITHEEAKRILAKHAAALEAAGPPASVERCQVANRRCRELGLVEYTGGGPLLVKIGGEAWQRGHYCPVCEGGEWWLVPAAVEAEPNLADGQRLEALADKAREILPKRCKSRIAKAVELVEAGMVELHANGTATVRSQSDDGEYHVNGQCDCPDAGAVGWRGAPRVAVNGRRVPACKHQIAVWLSKRLGEAG